MDRIYDLISTKNITFIRDIQPNVKVCGEGQYKFYDSKFTQFELININEINNFLNLIDNDSIYQLILFISPLKTNENPWLTLSKIFLVTKFSNASLITDYINNQYKKAYFDFRMNPTHVTLTIKYRKVTLKVKNF